MTLVFRRACTFELRIPAGFVVGSAGFPLGLNRFTLSPQPLNPKT